MIDIQAKEIKVSSKQQLFLNQFGDFCISDVIWKNEKKFQWPYYISEKHIDFGDADDTLVDTLLISTGSIQMEEDAAAR